MRPLVRGLGTALVAAGVLWSAGLVWFNGVARQASAPPPVADGIVALTGGAARIETALRLLADNVAPLLLVSGVAHGVELADLASRAPDGAMPEHRITLGHAATSTLGNAAEVAAWAHAHAMRSLVVVTAGYHMPRALLEIGRALPGVVLYPVPVQPPALRGAADPATLRVLALEYNKWLAVRLRLAHWLRTEDGS